MDPLYFCTTNSMIWIFFDEQNGILFAFFLFFINVSTIGPFLIKISNSSMKKMKKKKNLKTGTMQYVYRAHSRTRLQMIAIG